MYNAMDFSSVQKWSCRSSSDLRRPPPPRPPPPPPPRLPPPHRRGSRRPRLRHHRGSRCFHRPPPPPREDDMLSRPRLLRSLVLASSFLASESAFITPLLSPAAAKRTGVAATAQDPDGRLLSGHPVQGPACRVPRPASCLPVSPRPR